MFKKILKSSLALLFFVALFTALFTQTSPVSAGMVANHQIFSSKTIKKRLATILKR